MGLGLWAPSVRDSVAVNRVLVSTLTSRGRCVASSGPSFSSDLRVVLPDSPDPPRSREPFLLCPAWWRWRQREAEQQWPQALCLAQPFPIPFGCHRVRWPLPPKHRRLRCTAESLDPPSFALWPQAPRRSSPRFWQWPSGARCGRLGSALPLSHGVQQLVLCPAVPPAPPLVSPLLT